MFIQFYQIPCVSVGGEFPGSHLGFARLLTLSRTYIAGHICLIENKIWVFHPRGGGGGGGVDLPHLASPKHTKFIIIILCIRDLYLLLFYTTVSLNFGHCPISELTTIHQEW